MMHVSIESFDIIIAAALLGAFYTGNWIPFGLIVAFKVGAYLIRLATLKKMKAEADANAAAMQAGAPQQVRKSTGGMPAGMMREQ